MRASFELETEERKRDKEVEALLSFCECFVEKKKEFLQEKKKYQKLKNGS